MMGSERFRREKPIHKVSLRDFDLCRYPVSQFLWAEVMDKKLPERLAFDNPHRPVEGVSWWEAIEFCNQLSLKTNKQPCYERIGEEGLNIIAMTDGYQLPTEAEWEYAARGRQLDNEVDYPYSGSYELPEVAWKRSNSYDESIPTGLKRPNALGLYDMSGNLWEWVQDWYDPDYYQKCAEKSIIDNPLGPQSRDARVVRGGSWGIVVDDYFPVSGRSLRHPMYQDDGLGFRVSRYPITL